MPQQMIWFFVSIAFSFIAWGLVAARYIWPEFRLRPRAEALLIVPNCYISPTFLKLLKRGHENASQGKLANPSPVSMCA